jgi:hypothetical protein
MGQRRIALRVRGVAVAVVAALAATLAQGGTGQTDVLDEKALPLGDGRISTEAKQGQVFACATQFRAGGARHAGDWIQGSTWDATRKIWVRGEVLWPDARFSIQTKANQRVLTGNAWPAGHATGTFPIARTDPAFVIDGFGIYSGHDDNGKEITNTDLDECHGRVSPVMWDGKRTAMYHYVMTREYPYTLGCYRGSAASGRMQPRADAPTKRRR